MDFKKMSSEYKLETAIIIIIMTVIAIIAVLFAWNRGNRNFNKGVMQLEATYMKNHEEEYNELDFKIKGLEAKEERLMDNIEEHNKEIDILKNEKKKIGEEISKEEEKLDKIENFENTISSLETEISSLEIEFSSLETNVEKLKNERDSLQDDVDALNGKLVEAAGAPIELQAGMWFQEVDEIPEGRYTVSDGDSNFFVYDEDGDIYVNIILDDSNSGFGVSEYTFVLLEGSIIETKSACTLTPVK